MNSNQVDFQKLMQKGHSAAWDQKWEQAAGYYSQALEMMPDNPDALTSLGLALFELQDFEKSFNCYQRAARLIPDDPLPLSKLALILAHQGKTEDAVKTWMSTAELYLKIRDVSKAIEAWMRVLALNPEHLMARTRLAMVYERLGRKAEAVNEYLVTASLAQRGGNAARALQIAEYCLQLMPDNGEAQQAIAMLRSRQMLPSPMVPRLEAPAPKSEVARLKAPDRSARKELDPVNEARQKAISVLAGLLFEQTEDEVVNGQVKRRGIGALTRGTGGLTLSQAERARVQLHIGQVIDALSTSQEEVAMMELERTIDTGFSNPAAYYILGLLLAQREDGRAHKYLQKAINHPDFALGGCLLLGRACERTGDYADAASYYLQALRLADIESVAAEQADELGQLYEPLIESFAHSDDVEQQKSLCASISAQLMRPDWRNFLKTARKQLPAQTGGGTPLPIAEMLLETGSGQVVEALSHVRELAAQKKFYAAMEEAYQALEVAPTYLPLHIEMGELLLQDGRLQEAVNKFSLVSDLYIQRGEAAHAIRILQRVSQAVPMDLSIRSRLIELLIAQGRVDEAIQQYMNLADLYYQLAELEMARKTYTAALKLSQQASTDKSWNVRILYKIADIDLQRLDIRQAVRVFEQIRTIEPEDDIARAQLVELNYRLGQDEIARTEMQNFVTLLEGLGKRKEAITFIKDLLKERGDKLEIRRSLAELYVRSGMPAMAVEQFDQIADALLAQEKRSDAITMLQNIVALNPPNVEEYKAAIEKIKNG